MTRQPARPVTSGRRRTAWLAVLASVLALGGSASGAAFVPEPSSDVTVVAVAGKDYLELGSTPVTVPLVGPGRLYGFMRVNFAPGDEGQKTGQLQIAGIGERVMRLPLTFTPSPSSTWDDGRRGNPSGGRKFEVYVPAGVWNASLTATVGDSSLATAILYYDGPPQGARPGSAAAAPSPWRFINSVTLECIYDDNIYTLHAEAIEAFRVGLTDGLPLMESSDDFIFAPTLDLAAERRFWSPGKTRLRFKVKRWMYAANPIKTNTDFDFYVRQWFPGGKSLELYLHHAPEQYIRQLGDRSPYGGVSEVREFRFARNIVNLTWRHFVNRQFSYSVTVENNRRYYNKPFMENDIEAWEVRGSAAYRFFDRKLRASVDYSFEDASGRGHDSVDETRDRSDDSDPSYHRDLYRLGLDLTTPWLEPVADGIGVAYLFMDYYYTTDKDLFESPYQVGRRDKWTKMFAKAGKRLRKGVDLDFTFTYSERQVESPWYGDITLDKDYISRRYSLALTYDF